MQIVHLYLRMKKNKSFKGQFLFFDQYILHCLTSNHYLKKSLIVFCVFDLIRIFSTFFANEPTLRKTSFSASFSSKGSYNLSSITKTSPEFTAGFE